MLGEHSSLYFVWTRALKKDIFAKLNHQNGSQFYNSFFMSSIHGIYYKVKSGNHNWGFFLIKHTVSN